MKTKTEGEEILATYSLCVIGTPRPRMLTSVGGHQETPRYLADFIAETEENLTDLLPAGYRVVIREWNDETEETLT